MSISISISVYIYMYEDTPMYRSCTMLASTVYIKFTIDNSMKTPRDYHRRGRAGVCVAAPAIEWSTDRKGFDGVQIVGGANP